MINHYYTSIGLDPLGPYCPNPLLPNPNLAKNNQPGAGEYVTVTEKVKKVHVVKVVKVFLSLPENTDVQQHS